MAARVQRLVEGDPEALAITVGGYDAGAWLVAAEPHEAPLPAPDVAAENTDPMANVVRLSGVPLPWPPEPD